MYLHHNSLGTRATYSTGRVTVPAGYVGNGGLIGLCRPHPGDEPKASYWDTEASGVSSGECATGHTTAQLQAPTGYDGIYSTWNLDVDGDGTGDDPWDFGSSSQYPVLKYCAAKPGIDTADGLPYCPLQAAGQRSTTTALRTLSAEDEDDPVVLTVHTVDPEVVAKVRSLAAQTQHGTAHVNRWNRVLAAFGEHDGTGVTGGPMTADEAQDMADAHSSPVWDLVVAELTALEAVPQQTPPPPLPVVSVTEGGSAEFTVSASPAPAASIDVTVTITAAGDWGVTAGRPTILLNPLRDGNLSRNIFVHLSADQTSTTVTVDIGTEHQLALVLAWNTGLANHQAQGNVTYTD